MKYFNNFKLHWVFLLFVFIYSIQVLPSLYTDSLTNDEPAEITNGYYYLTQGDVVTPHLHPPLASALTALPLLMLNLKTFPLSGDVIDRAHFFIFEWNHNQLAAITALSRSVNWFFGLLIGFCLFWITWSDAKLCAATLFFWAFNPTLLGLAGVAKIEVIPTFFFLVAIWMFRKSLENFNARLSFFSGVVAAMAVTSKLYCLTLIPIFFLLERAHFRENGSSNIGAALKRWIGGLAGFSVFVFLLYMPAFVFSPRHPGVFSNLAEKFMEDLVFAKHPFPVYLFGRCALENHWYYLPIAFLLKEPLPFIFHAGVNHRVDLFSAEFGYLCGNSCQRLSFLSQYYRRPTWASVIYCRFILFCF